MIDKMVEKHYEIVSQIGKGAYGYVYKVRSKRTGHLFALKRIFNAFKNKTDAQRTYRQVTFLLNIKNPNIVRLIKIIPAESKDDLFLLFEFMDADLSTAVNYKILKKQHIVLLMYQAFKAIHFLHSSGIIHRDIKPSNILINQECNLKLCDFGLVRKYQNAGEKCIMTQRIGTRWYRSPQVILGQNMYGPQSDMWSMGCVFAQCLMNQPIFPGTSNFDQLEQILSFTGLSVKSFEEKIKFQFRECLNLKQQKGQLIKRKLRLADETGFSLIQSMLKLDPAQRIKSQQALKHPFFKIYFNPTDLSPLITPIPVQSDKLNIEDYKRLLGLVPSVKLSNGFSFRLNVSKNQSTKSFNRNFLSVESRRSLKNVEPYLRSQQRASPGLKPQLRKKGIARNKQLIISKQVQAKRK